MEIATRALGVLAGCALAAVAMGAQWKQLAKGPAGELWVDVASIKRDNGEAAFDYRIDYPAPQREVGSQNFYRSTVTRALVRCSARALAMGPTIAYAGARATGKVIGRYPPSPEEARFQPVELGSSDENLWRHVCKLAEVKPQK
jgi:hypothetical protein